MGNITLLEVEKMQMHLKGQNMLKYNIRSLNEHNEFYSNSKQIL